MRIDCCSCCSAGYQWYMLMTAKTSVRQLPGDVLAISQESRWFQDRPKSAPNPRNAANHPELAHIRPYFEHAVVPFEFNIFWHKSTCCQPRMFVQKVPMVFELMIVHFNAKPDIAFSLINMFMEFGYPYCIVPVHVFVKLLQS